MSLLENFGGRIVSESPPVSDETAFTKCYGYLPENRANAVVAISLRDTGNSNTILPVSLILARAGYGINFIVDGPGEKLLLDRSGLNLKKFVAKDDLSGYPDALLTLSSAVQKSDCVIVSQSLDAGIDQALIAEARAKEKISIAIEDFPGVDLAQNSGLLTNESPWVEPDIFCVTNKWAKDRLLDQKPNIDRRRIKVTGCPIFDDLSPEKARLTRKSFRDSIGLSDKEKIIAWMGQHDGRGLSEGRANSLSFKLFIDGLNTLKEKEDVQIVIRRHPADKFPQDYYENAIRKIGLKLVNTGNVETSVVRAGVDLVVALFSTVVLEAMFEGTPSVCLMVPEYLVTSGYDKFVIPFTEDGTTIVVRKESDMADILQRALNDQHFRDGLRRRVKEIYPSGNAAKNIAEVIKTSLVR